MILKIWNLYRENSSL